MHSGCPEDAASRDPQAERRISQVLTKELRLASTMTQQTGTARPKDHGAQDAWGCEVTCTRSTHVYRAPTVSQAQRRVTTAGVPRAGSQGYPSSLEEARMLPKRHS